MPATLKKALQGPRTLKTLDVPDPFPDDGELEVITPQGPIKITFNTYSISCQGDGDSLASFGLIHGSWLPGHDGNNKHSQVVIFSNDGPYLVIGRCNKTLRNTAAGGHLDIQRFSAKRYWVSIPTTVTQKNLIRSIVDAREKRERAERAAAAAAPLMLSPRAAHELICERVNWALAVLRKSVEDTGCGFTDDSLYRIHAAVDELRTAYANGRLIEKPRFPAAGNVFEFPRALKCQTP